MPQNAARRPSKVPPMMMQFSLKEQKVVVRYLHQQEVDSSEIHKLLTASCGEAAPSYKEVREWITDIVEGREEIDMCVCDGGGMGRKKSGAQADATDPALVTRLEYLINKDYRITIERLSEESLASIQTTQNVLNLLGLKRVSDRWVPRTWTPEQRQYRIDICQQLTDLYNAEGLNLMNRLIVGDDSFVMYHKNQNPGCGAKFRPADDLERVYCYFYYDKQGIIVADMLESSDKPSVDDYIQLIRDTVLPAWKRKRNNAPGPYYLLQSVTPIHQSLEVQKAFRELDIILLPNAPTSPDLEPMEYWLFRNLKKHLESLNFQSRTDMWAATKSHIYSITDLEFSNSITKLVDRWSICMEKQGLYLL